MISEEFGPWIGTATGNRFYLLNPNMDDVTIEDVAISLSKICRFNGHLKPEYLLDIYSVAQHSFNVWHLVKNVWGDAEAAKWAFAHDWLEAFYGDNTSPLKVAVPELKTIEKAAQPGLIDKYGIPYDERIEAVVKKADLTVGYREAEIFQDIDVDEAWQIGFIPEETMHDIDPNFACWDPRRSYGIFMKTFRAEFGDAVS